MTVIVHKPGLLTTIQDLGRYKFQQYGVIVAGAMDTYAAACANLLVGNGESEALLEVTVTGPSLYFERSAIIAICGADMAPRIHSIPVPMWRPVYVRPGTLLEMGAARQGCRAYIAFAGGLRVAKRMDSYATYLRAAIGGYEGRALRAGDRLPVGPASSGGAMAAYMEERAAMGRAEAPFAAAPWRPALSVLPRYTDHPQVRFVPGAHYGSFDEDSVAAFVSTDYEVGTQSDRMGYRLSGRRLRLKEPLDIWSEPVAFGSVQVPPDGGPIILMADRQTTGGYPVIAQVISADLPLVAQTPLGGRIGFRPVHLKEAQQLLLAMCRDLKHLKLGVRLYVG